MSDTRTYIVPDGQENSTNQMLPWMAMMNGGMGGFGNGMWNNPFMYLVWMWMMRWMNNGEWGNGNNCQNLQSAEIQGQLAGLREQMNTNQNTQLLMDAINGKKLMRCLSELESKSGEHYMERYGKRRRGGMRDSDYDDDEDYPRYY